MVESPREKKMELEMEPRVMCGLSRDSYPCCWPRSWYDCGIGYVKETSVVAIIETSVFPREFQSNSLREYC